jgi:methyl-accepting chemotaxis protein
MLRSRRTTDDAPELLAKVGPFTALDAVPVPILLLDRGGEVVYRNQAALAMATQVSSTRGELMLQRMRDAVRQIALEERVFPVRKVVEAHQDGQHAEAEMVVNRLSDGQAYTVFWREITSDRDTVRATEAVAQELKDASGSFRQLGDRLLKDAAEVSTRASLAASGSEQMSAGIRDVAGSAAAALSETAAAVHAAEQASRTLGQLADSSARISAVSNLITGIAEQTNLLALNATIEAARAGTAGRGFAVVAGEVKELASRTATATGEIGEMIAGIQRDSTEAEASIREITRVIESIQRQQATVAGAVELQTSAADEISTSMSAAAHAALSAAEVADELRERAGFVSDKSAQLRTLFDRR